MNTTTNGAPPPDPFDRLEELVRELARQRLPQGARPDVDAALARLEALLVRPGAATVGELPDGDVYLATDLTPSSQALDHDELIEVVYLPFAEVAQMVERGGIEDSKTIIALLLAVKRVQFV